MNVKKSDVLRWLFIILVVISLWLPFGVVGNIALRVAVVYLLFMSEFAWALAGIMKTQRANSEKEAAKSLKELQDLINESLAPKAISEEKKAEIRSKIIKETL